jgi:hypothetical protein
MKNKNLMYLGVAVAAYLLFFQKKTVAGINGAKSKVFHSGINSMKYANWIVQTDTANNYFPTRQSAEEFFYEIAEGNVRELPYNELRSSNAKLINRSK